MNEMIYGNTGKRDEGINIDMDQSLYQKLQSRTFVPKLKSMLNDSLQEGDKNFVYIGEVVDKTGSFSVYGYNAKLAGDSRGGDYGHYIAVPLEGKPARVDIDKVRFLKEEGFAEYVNLKTLNNDKRFVISPTDVNIDANAKKRIINNLMETFMKVRKRKNVTFSFDDNSAEEFTSKSIYVLMDLMKYIPYQMRKNVSFISHVASSQKLPDMINLASYPRSSEFKPHDCISISGGADWNNDGIFSAFVEKVFGMSDSERCDYFEKIYTEIEKPAIDAGAALRSDLYLLDVTVKELWLNGDAGEAVKSIFSSVEDILKVYPKYREIAVDRMSSSRENVYEYIKNGITAAKNAEELKSVYVNIMNLSKVCGVQLSDAVMPLMKEQTSKYINDASKDDELMKVADEVIDITPDVLDKENTKNKILNLFKLKTDLSGIFDLYLKLKGKNFIAPGELELCLVESLNNLITTVTDKYSEAKEKLSALDEMYRKFKSNCPKDCDYSPVREVYNIYKARYSSGASEAAINAGNNIINEVKQGIRDYRSTFLDIKDCIIKLDGIEVGADEGLKNATSEVYKMVSEKMFGELCKAKLSYAELKKLFQEIEPAVKSLNENGVYDDQLRSGWGTEKFVPDGLFRLLEILAPMIKDIDSAEDLTEALASFEQAKGNIKEKELKIQAVFERFAPVILFNWLDKNKKFANERSLKKAEKEIGKLENVKLSDSTIRLFDSYFDNPGKQDKNDKKSGRLSIPRLIILSVAGLILIAGLAFGGIMLYRALSGKSEPAREEPTQATENNKNVIYKGEVDMVEAYLKGFDHEDLFPAQFVLGTIAEGENPDKKYTVKITDSLKSEFSGDITATYIEHKNSKKYYQVQEVDKGKEYAIVLQRNEPGEVYIRDIYAIPNDLKGHDFRAPYSDEKVKDDKVGQAFYANVIRYIGMKDGIVQEVKTHPGEEKGEIDGQEPTKNTENSSETEKDTEPGKETGNAADGETNEESPVQVA